MSNLTFSKCVLVAAALLAAGCTWGLTKKVNYHLPALGNLPIGTAATDRSAAFARRFCGTLRHLDPSQQTWGACAQWLHAAVAEQPPDHSPIPTNLGVIVVPGLFADCFKSTGPHVFEQGLEHLRTAHSLKAVELPVSGFGSAEANAVTIEKFLENNAGEYIAIGYSKGIADLMVALHDKPHARSQIKALISVAGAVGGSWLADLPDREAINAFERVVRDTGLGECGIIDGGALRSLRREERYRFLAQWQPPAGLRSFSVVGSVEKHQTSSVLHLLWERVHYYSFDQDSQVVVQEGVIPGARYLGAAKGDHWALALPFSELSNSRLRADKVDQNKFPRTAFLEALVREVFTP